MAPERRENRTLLKRLLAMAVWIGLWQAASAALGHNGLLLASPLQTLRALAELLPTAEFRRRVLFSTGRILLGFVLAVAAGTALGFAAHRFTAAELFISPVMSVIRAMPVASFVILALLWVRGSNLSVVVCFTHVLPVTYAGTLSGLAAVDSSLAEMARVFRLPGWKRFRYILLPGLFPAFREACTAALGMCWKSGVSAEIIGLPDHSVGDALYRAKITLSTPEVFAWTAVIIVLSALLTKLVAMALRFGERKLCGEVSE